MNGVRIIKAYRQVLKTTKHNPSSLTYAEDLAITEFRAFHKTASVHLSRIDHPLACDVMREVLADLSEKMLHKVKT